MADRTELIEATKAGWNACRKSVYAVCEDVGDEVDRTRISAVPGNASEEQHAKGYHAGTHRAAKSIARGFNSMEAEDDDNFREAIAALRAGAGVHKAWSIAEDALASISGERTPKYFPETSYACAERALKEARSALSQSAQSASRDEVIETLEKLQRAEGSALGSAALGKAIRAVKSGPRP